MKKRGEYYITQFFYLNLQTLILISKMKQLKFLMAALTLLMGISLTSCLNSDSNSDNTQGHFARVKQGDMTTGYSPYFEDYAGNKLLPTVASLTQIEASGDFKMSSSNFVFITYKLAEIEKTAKSETGTTPSSYDITLLSAVACDGPTPIMVENNEAMENTVVENAPIFTLIYNASYSYSPFLYDKETLFLPIYYKMENKAEQVKQHKLNLVCNFEGIASGSTEIVFYVRHDRGTDEKNEALNVAYNGYDIKTAIARFSALAGNEPKKIVIKVKETGEYSSSNTMPEEYTTYSCDFKEGSIISKNN